MNIIDLHGIKHENVTKIIIDACAKLKTPITVITGNSDRMKQIVQHAANQLSLYSYESVYNVGRVIIDESR
jgi:hypothetical protein